MWVFNIFLFLCWVAKSPLYAGLVALGVTWWIYIASLA